MAVLGSNTTTVDLGTTIALSLLGGIYGVIGLSAFVFIALPKLMAGAGTAAAGVAGAPATGAPPGMFPIRAARLRPPGVRWSPAYGGDVTRARPDASQALQQQRMRRLYADANRRFPALNQVGPIIEVICVNVLFFFHYHVILSCNITQGFIYSLLANVNYVTFAICYRRSVRLSVCRL